MKTFSKILLLILLGALSFLLFYKKANAPIETKIKVKSVDSTNINDSLITLDDLYIRHDYKPVLHGEIIGWDSTIIKP